MLQPSKSPRSVFIGLNLQPIAHLKQVNVESMLGKNVGAEEKPSTAINSPTTYSNVYIRVQPFLTSLSPDSDSDDSSEEDSDEDSDSESTKSSSKRLQFLIYLHDPEHKLISTTITQGVSSQWLPLWDEYDWVEDLVADALRLGVEVIGQEYLVARMGWGGKKESSGNEKATESSTAEKGKDGEAEEP